MSYNVKEMLFGCREHFCHFLLQFFVPCCKQSLETGSKSSFFPLLALNVRVSDTCLCFITAPVHPLFIHLCSLPIAVSIFVPLVNAHSMFPQSWENWIWRKPFIEALRGCRCLTEMHVKQSHSASFHSDISPGPPSYSLDADKKKKQEEKGSCVVPTALKWLHRE